MNSYLYERQSLKISLGFVILLMIWGLVFNELTESNIVELDAGSYVISGIIGIITIYVSRLQEKRPSESHPLGYYGFIPILNLIRNLMIVLICIKAIGESIGSIISGPSEAEHGILFLYASVTLLLNLLCYIYLSRAARKTNSPLLKTDALEWKIDAISNISILAAFGLSYVLEHQGYVLFSMYIDPIMCILFSIYMCIAPAKLFVENMQTLSIASIDKDSHEALVNKFVASNPIFSVHPTQFYILNIAGVLWVNFEIRKHAHEKITLDDLARATSICQQIMDEINPKNKLSYVYLDHTEEPQTSEKRWDRIKKTFRFS